MTGKQQPELIERPACLLVPTSASKPVLFHSVYFNQLVSQICLCVSSSLVIVCVVQLRLALSVFDAQDCLLKNDYLASPT